MCSTIYFSTTSDEDLGAIPSDLFSLHRKTVESDRPQIELLSHSNIWHLRSYSGGCSCHFRHVLTAHSEEDFVPEFSAPDEWILDEPHVIEATGAIYDVFKSLSDQGHLVDLVDRWSDSSLEEIETVEVSFAQVSRDQFRFFDNYRFVFTP